MSDSTENTNELDSYGVWVKNSKAEEPAETMDFSDSLDLPDFEETTDFTDTDFSDMFNEDSTIPAEEPIQSMEGDSTLTSDELLNITSSEDVIIDEGTSDDNLSLDDDFSIDESLSLDSDLSLDDNISLDDGLALDDSLSLDDGLSLDDSLSLDDGLSLDDNLTLDDNVETAETTEASTDDLGLTDSDFNFEETSLDFNDSDFNLEETTDTTTEAIETETVPEVDDAFSFDDDLTLGEDTVTTEEVSEDAAPVEESFDLPADDFETFDTSDMFESTESAAVSEETIETTESFDTPAAEETEEVSFDGGEEEISLDDFMDSGFSDVSVAAGNNGFEPGKGPSAAAPAGDEEISLDDFLDGDSFASEQKEEEIVDEKPLDMDISFDESADSVETVANTSIDSDNYEMTYDEEEPEVTAEPSEEVSIDEFTTTSSGDSFDSEEIDLSDFGIDADAEETPVTQDVEGSKNKEEVVDYDLTVSSSNAASAPIVNEIKEEQNDFVSEAAPVTENVVAAPQENADTAVSSSLLQQIVADLSSLRNEINSLKSNLNDMKSKESTNFIAEDPIIEDTVETNSGFFSGDDGDDTIALSNDELNNIMNTAELNVAEPAEVQDSFEDEEPVVVEEAPFDMDVETAVSDEEVAMSEEDEAGIGADETIDMNFQNESLEEPNFEDDTIEVDEDTVTEEIFDEDLPAEIAIPKDDILVESSSNDFMDSIQNVQEVAPIEETTGFVSSEPTLVEESLSAEEVVLDDELPIDQPEDVFESVNETTEEIQLETETHDSFGDVSEFDSLDTMTSEPVIEATEEPVMADETENFSSVDSFDSVDNIENTLSYEDTIAEPTVIEEEPVIETAETSVDSDDMFSDLQDNFVTDETKSDLTESNLNYLAASPVVSSVPTESNSDANTELKKDIKSVLLYMDQLLENLPEDKIVEFAKSEEFTTYKKLFSELGLS